MWAWMIEISFTFALDWEEEAEYSICLSKTTRLQALGWLDFMSMRLNSTLNI